MAKRCFVIQGFGKKQDYEQGKLFDLDASYEIIKEAVTEAGLKCYRADELRRNAVIDQIMYEELFGADLVIADITTLNFNAAFELGVRFALRPYATLVVGEKGMNFPFDVNHIYIHGYEHLGPDVGRREAQRFQNELKEMAQKAVSDQKTDSPVYTFLKRLPDDTGFIDTSGQTAQVQPSPEQGKTLRELTNKAMAAMNEGRFIDAVQLWEQARDCSGKDDHIVQQLALATYKSKSPDVQAALHKAKGILSTLQPDRSFDTETLGLWAAVHKRLYELTPNDEYLEEALFSLERGFFIKRDYYSGINLAFMLDKKAAGGPADQRNDLHAVARHVRRNVKDVCLRAFEDTQITADEKYWVLATMYEACVGLGEKENAEKWRLECEKAAAAQWMIESTNEQIVTLSDLLILD